ncbi:MAG: hypothetical protein RLY78_497 [Pseudomonadota bacterium]
MSGARTPETVLPQLPSAPRLSTTGPGPGPTLRRGQPIRTARTGTPGSVAAPEPAAGWLLDSAVHELKGPAAAMLDLAALMADDADAPLSPRQRRQLEHLMSAGRHLLGLLDDLRDSDSGLWPCHAEQVDLQSLAAQALGFHTAPAARRGLSLRLAGTEPTATAWADPRRTLQVLLNLIANAVRYSRQGTTVAVHVGPGPCFSVHDEGPGLDAAALERVFIPGERLGRTDGQGQGLGLALSRALLRRMGGQLEFHSEPGRGSVVSVRLPGRAATAAGAAPVEVDGAIDPGAPATVREPAARLALDHALDLALSHPIDHPASTVTDTLATRAAHTAQPAGATGSAPAMRSMQAAPALLCVDANPVLAQWLDARLVAPRANTATACTASARPWQIRQTASLTEALALAQTCRPALVLVDPALPGGWELLSAWQADAQLRRIPVVVVSAAVDPRLWLRARALGALDCWPKPPPLARLHALLARLSAARHPSVPAPKPLAPRATVDRAAVQAG